MMPRVLLVDDDPHVLASLVRLLSVHCSVEIVIETSAARALERLDADRFDLLVADLRLPGLSGDKLLEVAAARWPAMRRALLTGAIVDDFPQADALFMKGGEPSFIADCICRLAKFQRSVP